MSAPAIQSVGPPPERHADRVVAEMTRWLQAEAERHFPMIIAVLREPRPGNAKAQARHLARLRRAAGPMLLDAKLEPGTRGKYAVHVHILFFSDDTRQVVVDRTILRGLGNHGSRNEWQRALLISHHAMVRMAMRNGVRTIGDLHAALAAIGRGFVVHETELTGMPFPPAGRRFAFAGGVAVVRRDPRGGLVVATVLESKQEEESK